MGTSLYDLTIPPLLRGLTALQNVLEKGHAHAQAAGLDEKELMGARLAPDMLPFTAQIQIACDTAKGAAARLADVENPRMEDNEASFDELKARVAKTLDFVKSVGRDQIDGREAASIVLKFPNGEYPFTGLGYAQGFALPNFYFHAATAYGLLRQSGAPLGKTDFLGA